MKSMIKRFSYFILILLISVCSVFAQDLDEVTISGKVSDTNNAPIVGATVAAKLVATGAERTAITDSEGRFKFIELAPGTYTVKVSMTGFGAQEQTDLVTVSGQNVQLNFTLAPAGVTAEQTVTIGGDDAPIVDTSRTIVGSTITEREVQEIPNNTRNPLDLVLTLGGTSEEALSTRDLASDRGERGISTPGSTPDEAGIFSLSGGAAYSNNITIDGLDNNDDRSASFRFQPSIESVAEVQVVTNQFSAEYGRASGGRVNVRTRAGGNTFRGRAFYFFRDDNLNANTWNNNRRGIERPQFTNHNPGFTFGGPIIKNKLFFFTAYEYDNIKEDTIVDVWVPVTNGNTRFNLPSPNGTQIVTVTSGTNTVQVAQYISPFETPAKKHIFQTRFDYNLNSKHNFTFNYQLGRSNDLRSFSGTNRLADSIIGRIRNTDAFNATYNYIVSSKAANQFRFQYSRLRPSSAQNAGELAPAVLITFTAPGEGSTTQLYGSTSNSSDREEDRWQLQNTFIYATGDHTFRVGGDYQKVDSLFIDRFDATGTYRFTNFAFFNIGSVSSFQQNFNTASEVNNTYYGLFFQDDWKVRSNLTLSFGLRYEKEKVIDDKNNFGPRFAVAWNPFSKTDKTVIRFGAGIFYNRVLLRTIDDFTSDSQELRFDSGSLRVPTGVTVDTTTVRNFLNTQFPNGLSLDTVVPVNATNSYTVRELSNPASIFRRLDPNLKIPESYQFNIGFEREIFKGIAFETNFTYNKTVRLWREFNANAPLLPSGTPDRDSDGQITFTDYLLGVNTGNTTFVLGSPTDTVGITAVGGGTCTSAATNCVVNLNTTNVSTATCSTPPSTVTNTPRCRAFAAINNLRPGAATGFFGTQEQVASIGDSLYMGLTTELRTRYRKYKNGFATSMRFVYTLASFKDDGIVNTSEATLPGDFNREFSRALQDRRHRISFSGSFDTPYWLGKIRFSPLFRFGSSAPFNVGLGRDRNLDGLANDRPNFSGDLSDISWRRLSTAFPADLAARFTLAPIGSPGNLPRNAGKGPRFYALDLNLSREFRFGERFRLRPTAEFTNLFNMTVFSFGSNFIDFDLFNSTDPATLAAAREAFLAPTRTYRPRQIRFGLRFDF